jgi:hypothetical protein
LRREARSRKARFYLVTVVPGALLLSSPWLGYLLSDSAATRLIQLGCLGRRDDDEAAWTLRVRRVEVDASAVRIQRGEDRHVTLGSAEVFGLSAGA